jgi:hypothetical protein
MSSRTRSIDCYHSIALDYVKADMLVLNRWPLGHIEAPPSQSVLQKQTSSLSQFVFFSNLKSLERELELGNSESELVTGLKLSGGWWVTFWT